MNKKFSKSVLIVDDSIDLRDLLTQLLESSGYLVKCRNNGKEALDLLNSGGYLPTVILLDLRMPIMDGVDFLAVQSKSSRLKGIPVILMTAEDDLSRVKDKFEIHQILSKPLDMKSVLRSLDSF